MTTDNCIDSGDLLIEAIESFCIGKEMLGRKEILSVQESRTSLLPRPNPLITFPLSFRGKGGEGPLSGPATASRGTLGRMLGVK